MTNPEQSTIEALGPLGAKLNAESDDLNQIITTISEKLAALNLGIPVWTEGDEEPETVRFGFAKVQEGGNSFWALATRLYYDGEPYQKEVPLTKVSRDLRICGLQEVPGIIDMLKCEAERRLDAIAKARKLAAEI